MRFAVLLVLSVLIATGGVLGDQHLAAEIGKFRPGIRLAIRAVEAQRFEVVATTIP